MTLAEIMLAARFLMDDGFSLPPDEAIDLGMKLAELSAALSAGKRIFAEPVKDGKLIVVIS